MIQSLTVTNHLGKSLTLELANPEGTGLVIRSIDGLGPPKASVNMSEVAMMDGSLYNSARVGSRNIVITLSYKPTPPTTVESLRQMTYRYFPIKKQVTLRLLTGNREVEIDGYVESNTPNVFSSDSTTQISVVCEDAYFRSAGDSGLAVTEFFSVEPRFEFPFGNESTVSSLLEMSDVVNGVERQVLYEGDAEVGMELILRATGAVGTVTIFNVSAQQSLTIDSAKLAAIAGSGIQALDEIFISTRQGAKGMWLLRGGVYTNILNSLGPNPSWLTLSQGENVLAYSATSGVGNLWFEIRSTVLYEGV